MTSDLLHDDVGALLRAGEHRYTTGRRQVVSALCVADGPVTIPEILDIDATLAQSSLYRSLAILEEVGAVARIVTQDDHSRYELAEQLTDHHHHHLICSNCGSVSDFELSSDLEKTLEQSFKRAARKQKFALEAHRLDLLGTCAHCG